MRVLGIETSGAVAGLALVDEQGVLSELAFRHGMHLSSTLTLRMETVLELAGLEVPDVQGVAVALGPGSFTGLRLGVAAAKAFAYGRDLPAAGVSTLEAMAAEHPSPPGVLLCALLPASGDQVFAGAYQWRNGRVEVQLAERLLTVAELAERLSGSSCDVLLIAPEGPHHPALARELGSRLGAVSMASGPHAVTVARLGRTRILESGGDPVHALSPRYLRPSTAEARRQEKLCPVS